MRCNTRLLALLFCCMSFMLPAQEISFSGTVYFGEETFPVPEYPVFLQAELPNGEVLNMDAVTNEQGNYNFTFDAEINNPQEFGVATISTFDFCTGGNQEFAFDFGGEFTLFENVDFSVCTEVDPPDPTSDCEAFFEPTPLADSPNGYQFVDLSFSGSPILSWFWDFGDGNTSEEQNPIHVYENEGGYDVVLTITTDSCAATVIGTVWVPNDEGCNCPEYYEPVCVEVNGDTIQFSNICFAECEGYSWDDLIECEIDDPCNCDDVYDPVCVYTPAGIVLTFSNPCEAECAGFEPDLFESCQDQQGCQALFYVDQPDFNSLTVLFNDISYTSEGTIITWEWEFGDGNFSTEASPTHTYEEPGIYDITLTITTDEGCVSTITEHICIGVIDDCDCPAEYDPVCIDLNGITFTFPNACEAECAGFSLEDQVDCESGSGCECPNDFDPVCVLVSAAGEIEVFPNPCYAECAGYGPDSFVDCEDVGGCVCPEYYDPVCVEVDGDTLTFDNPCFAECEGFGEDSFLEDCNQFEDCECPDFYDPVCFVTATGEVVTFENICFALVCEGVDPASQIDCNGNDPCVCPDIFAPVCVATANGETLSFVNSCYAECEGYTEEDFVDCEDLGDPCGCPLIYDPVCVETVFGIIEFTNACVAECEGFGQDSYVDCYDEPELDCAAFFFAESLDDSGLLVQFTDQSFADVGEIVTWEWSFGDGGLSTEQNPQHQYQSEGYYDVILTITTSEDCVATFHQHLYLGEGGGVDGPVCQSIFFFTQEENDQATFQFEDLSIGEVESWSWDFGDGNGSNEQNPTHTYTQDGVYLVTLTITTAECTSTMSMLVISNETIFYESECLALFIPFIDTENLAVVFLNLSSIFTPAATFEWDFGDGTTSTDPLPFHQYEAPGIYEVSLTITTAEGCVSTFSVTIDLDENYFTGNPSFLVVSSTADEVINTASLRLYPNPVSDQLTLDLESQKDSDLLLSLVGIDGKTYYSRAEQLQQGQQQVQLDVQNLVPGIYFVRLQTESGIESLKFVKE